MLELKNVTKIYKSKSGDTAALKKVNLFFGDTGLVFITGKSGSGKTTLLNTIGGLDSIDGGDIIINGKSFASFTADDYDSYRNTFIGFIFQEYNLLPEYTAEKNVMLANELQGVPSNDEEIAKIFELVDIAGLQKRKISELSGGQKQRVAIARALIKNPSIIMADEPTGALDTLMGVQVMNILKNLSKEKLVIVVSHDMELAETYADRIIRISDGVVVEDNMVNEVKVNGNIYVDENSVTVKQGSKLNNDEAQIIVNAVMNSTPITVTEDITVRKKTPTVIEKLKTGVTKTIDLIKSKMKYKSLALLGVKSLGVKPLRLAFTILLSAIAFAVFGLFDTVGAYNRTSIVANALKENDYSAISVNSVYYGEELASNVGVGEDYIKQISNDYGYDFRGVYGINTESSSVVNDDVEIADIMHSTRQDGIKYYSKTVNGFVEFKENEINPTTGVIDANGYNYKLLYGNYPSKVIDRDSPSLHQIAISKYLAECIKHYEFLVNSTKRVDKLEELIGQTIEFYGNNDAPYEIVGIIDCGDIPEKYNVLKTQYPRDVDAILAADLKTLLYSSMHLNIFVGENFVNVYRNINNRQTGYRSEGYKFSVWFDGMTANTTNASAVFYNSNDFDANSVVFFDDARATNNATGKIELADDEIMINVTKLYDFYSKEISAIPSTDNDNNGQPIKYNLNNHIKFMLNMFNSQYNANDEINNGETVFEAKRRSMNYFINAISGLSGNALKDDTVSNLYQEKVLRLYQQSKNTGKKEIKTFKVVGVYYGVDINATSVSYFNNILCNSNVLAELDVANKQGYYARMISPVVTKSAPAKKLAESITKKSGLGFNWFNNGILEAIDNNEDSIKQFANLFLYISIALAIFSVFMLFNYITTSINSKRRSIGVLRALGSNGMDIFKMFFTESVIIALINAIFAVGIAAIGCIFVNMYIRTVMNMSVSFALFTMRQVIIIVSSCVATALAACVIPIINIAKEKPVNLIARSN